MIHSNIYNTVTLALIWKCIPVEFNLLWEQNQWKALCNDDNIA